MDSRRVVVLKKDGERQGFFFIWFDRRGLCFRSINQADSAFLIFSNVTKSQRDITKRIISCWCPGSSARLEMIFSCRSTFDTLWILFLRFEGRSLKISSAINPFEEFLLTGQLPTTNADNQRSEEYEANDPLAGYIGTSEHSLGRKREGPDDNGPVFEFRTYRKRTRLS